MKMSHAWRVVTKSEQSPRSRRQKLFPASVKNRKIFKLKDQSLGLYIPPTIWYDILYKGSKNTIMVFTDKKYSISDYIETKKEYLNFIKKNESS